MLPVRTLTQQAFKMRVPRFPKPETWAILPLNYQEAQTTKPNRKVRVPHPFRVLLRKGWETTKP
jgi:hypothetical protein